MRACACCLAAAALTAALACGSSDSGRSGASGDDISCGALAYIAHGACTSFPPFSDASVAARDRDATANEAGATGLGADSAGNASALSMATSYLANPAHTNAIVDPTLVPPLAQLWSATYKGFGIAYPLVAGGAVYLLLNSATTGRLVALDEHTGKTLWGPTDLGATDVAGQAYDRGRVFTHSNSTGQVTALDAKSGATVWTTTVSGATVGGGPPTAYDGVLYLNGTGVVVALDESTGAQLWSTSTDISFGASLSPAVTDDGVFIAGTCGEAYALDRATGSVRWHHLPDCTGGFAATPIVFERRVYLVQADIAPTAADIAPTVVLDALTGAAWTTSSFTAGYPAFDQGHAFFIANSLDDLDLSSGQNVWTFQGDMALQSGIPFVAGGTVYVPSSTRLLFGVDELTGAQTWSTYVNSGAEMGACAVVGAEGVLVAVEYVGQGVVGYGHVDLPDASVVLGDGGAPVRIVLASGGGGQSLALDATNVYWTDNGGVRKVSKDGGASAVVNASPGSESWGVAVDSTHAYWTVPNFFNGGSDAGVMRIPLDGGAPTMLASVGGPEALVASSTTLYWTISTGPAIESVPIDGGPVSVVVSDPNGAAALAVDAHNLYWCGPDGVFQQPLAGGTALSIGPDSAAIAVDNTDVYYATRTGTVERVPIGGGTRTVLASGRPASLVAVAVDDQNVYWIEGEGTATQNAAAVAAVPKSGGHVAILASGLSNPSAIAVDDGGIYFTDGLVEKILK